MAYEGDGVQGMLVIHCRLVQRETGKSKGVSTTRSFCINYRVGALIDSVSGGIVLVGMSGTIPDLPLLNWSLVTSTKWAHDDDKARQSDCKTAQVAAGLGNISITGSDYILLQHMSNPAVTLSNETFASLTIVTGKGKRRVELSKRETHGHQVRVTSSSVLNFIGATSAV
jgi:hypothetical protein